MLWIAKIILFDCLEQKKAVIKGLKNMIVIDEGDVLLIYPKDQEQEIKSVRNDLNDDSVL